MKILEDLGITAVPGFSAAGVGCGIKLSGKKDVALLYSKTPCKVAAAFTDNTVVAAPVTYSKKLLQEESEFQALLINSGNANACTGSGGYKDAAEMSELTSKILGIESKTLIASTGLIGEMLPMEKVRRGIESAIDELGPSGGTLAAEAIMTTDAFKKEIAVELEIGGVKVRIGAMAKGAGMIAPSLIPHATMIAVVVTDADVSDNALSKSLAKGVKLSFNRSSVDGDTSTNDSVFLLANSSAKNPQIADGESFQVFQSGVAFVMTELAKMIIKDGEGATKLISYKVRGAKNDEDAAKIGMSLVNSLLVKTMFFGADPNWGRILAAAGASEPGIDLEKTSVYFRDQLVAKSGLGVDFDQKKVGTLLKAPEIELTLQVGDDDGAATCYGCDLNHEYIRINAEYTT